MQSEAANNETKLLCSLRDVEDATRELGIYWLQNSEFYFDCSSLRFMVPIILKFLEALNKKLQGVADNSDDLMEQEKNLSKINNEISVISAKMRDLTEQIDFLNSKVCILF